ncbi:uncharacterized protein LOC116646021 [Phoca vitulina]|uniref:uncharacterized protein LOC116646021 n=1 Tax=Phoca vitulina TaxID=9720 RepID=UPI001395F93A|nr:uncharacterized protein LOC116646021 [Phoca vitulina]
MAFGVKWNETGEESGRESAERRATNPAVGPGEARRPGAAGYSPHDTGVFSSEAGHAEAAGSCKTQSQDKADPGFIPGPGLTGYKVCREAAGVKTRELHRGRRNSLLAAPALQQQWPRPPPPPQPPAAAALFPLLPSGRALTELRRAPGRAFLLRHLLLLLLLLQWRLHLPLVAASVPTPGLVALLRLAPRSRRRPEHRGLRRPPPGREAATAGSREACELSNAGRGSARQRPGRAGCWEVAAPAAAETSFRSRGCPSSPIWRIRQAKKKKKKRKEKKEKKKRSASGGGGSGGGSSTGGGGGSSAAAQTPTNPSAAQNDMILYIETPGKYTTENY